MLTLSQLFYSQLHIPSHILHAANTNHYSLEQFKHIKPPRTTSLQTYIARSVELFNMSSGWLAVVNLRIL